MTTAPTYAQPVYPVYRKYFLWTPLRRLLHIIFVVLMFSLALLLEISAVDSYNRDLAQYIDVCTAPGFIRSTCIYHIPTLSVILGDAVSSASWFVLVFAAFFVQRRRLVTSPLGIAFSSGGAPVLMFTWDNLRRIEEINPQWRRLIIGQGGFLIAQDPTGIYENYFSPKRLLSIPLPNHWRTSQLGDDLRQHAPQLFQTKSG